MYKIYTDKKEEFTCQLEIEGADISNTTSRLILETDKGFSLLFPGKVSKDGKCSVNIDKIKNVLKENDGGSIKLEVIADDTIFVPWESNFTVKISKKVALAESSDLSSAKTGKPTIKAVVKEEVEDKPITESNLNKHVATLVKILEASAASKKAFDINLIFEMYGKQASLSRRELADIKKVFTNQL